MRSSFLLGGSLLKGMHLVDEDTRFNIHIWTSKETLFIGKTRWYMESKNSQMCHADIIRSMWFRIGTIKFEKINEQTWALSSSCLLHFAPTCGCSSISKSSWGRPIVPNSAVYMIPTQTTPSTPSATHNCARLTAGIREVWESQGLVCMLKNFGTAGLRIPHHGRSHGCVKEGGWVGKKEKRELQLK